MSTMCFPRRRAFVLPGVLAALTGCAFEFSETPVRPHGSAGAETFRILCMNLAAQSFPNDLTGRSFSARCDGQAEQTSSDPVPADEQSRAYQRFHALRSHRSELVSALDQAFDEAGYQADELRNFLAEMFLTMTRPSSFQS